VSKLLFEMFGMKVVGTPAINKIKEGPFDDINKQMSGAKSVAGNGGATRARVGQSGDVQKAQADLDGARSVFKKDEAAAGAQGITLNGDKETLGALLEALRDAEHSADDPDIANWAGRAWKAVAAGIRGDGSVTLPKFESAPEDLMPDEEPTEGDF
jgi:hypothetical protein